MTFLSFINASTGTAVVVVVEDVGFATVVPIAVAVHEPNPAHKRNQRLNETSTCFVLFRRNEHLFSRRAVAGLDAAAAGRMRATSAHREPDKYHCDK